MSQPKLVKSDSDAFHEFSKGGSPAQDLINTNVAAKIVNPLSEKTEAELMADVETFCSTHGFSDEIDLFKKGALVAQNPASFEDLPMLTEDDRYWLRREITNRWDQPKMLYFTIGVLSLGSAVQGWDNTGVNGANLSYPQEFGIADDQWLVGVIGSALTISGLVFCWTSDFFNNLLGRRGTVFLTGLFCIFPILAQGFVHTWQEMFIVRLLIGCALGIKIATIPIYSSEVSPASIRGGLTMQFQTWVAFGILVGFSSNLIFSEKVMGASAWRWQLAAAFVPAVPVCVLCWFCPESPRWLLKKKRFEKSFRAFCRLRNTKLQAARDMYYSWAQLQEEDKAFGHSTYFGRIRDLFVVPRIRRATLAGFVIMLSQQLSGINIVAFYSSTIFKTAGYSNQQALLASWGFAAITFVFAIPAWYTIDTFGRRTLLLWAFPFMAICLFVTGGVYGLPVDSGARLPLIVTFVYIFVALYGPSIGPTPAVLAGEVFPLSHRETGGAWCIFINNLFSTVLGLTFPEMLARLGGTKAFMFYGCTNCLAFAMIWFGIPETKQRTLEELDYIFSVPTSKFGRYQTFEWAPWAFKRYVLRQDVHIEPLYNLEEVSATKTYSTAVGH